MGCSTKNNKVDIYSIGGIPDENQSFSYLYFKNQNEGYLFGTIRTFEENNDTKIDTDSEKTNLIEQANIYKTTDGGRNWELINSKNNFSYFEMATVFENSICILRNDNSEDFKFNILKLNLLDNSTFVSKEIRPLSVIWNNGRNIHYTSNRNNIKLYSLNEKLNSIDSFFINDYAISAIYFKNTHYAVFSNKENTYFGKVNKEKILNIDLNITPKYLTIQDENKIIIVGNEKFNNNGIKLVSYDISNGDKKVVAEFKGYSIIQDFQSNNKVICGFIGNIDKSFIKYDLLYSIDKGNTWKIQKLKEDSYIRPNSLNDSTFFIYSGNNMIQKVSFTN